MFLLYLDESGNENDPKDRFFVLGGAALFERQTYFLVNELDQIHERYFPGHQPVDFHASQIRSGRDFWRSVPEETRNKILDELCAALVKSPARGRILFAAAIEKSNTLYGEDAVEKATEQICRRFDVFLTLRFKKDRDPQRGLIIFSEGRFDARAKIWVKGFHKRGTSWGAINNLADIPYFAATKESRLLQLADLVAHAVWLMYERKDPRLLKTLLPCFHRADGKMHGLVHVRTSTTIYECPACYNGNTQNYGPWVNPPKSTPAKSSAA